MDILSFEEKNIKSDFTGEDMTLAVIKINDTPLSDILEPFERRAAENCDGKYNGWGYEYQYADALFEQLVTKASQASEREAALMVCGSCYEEGCWPLLVTIDESDTEVIWHGLHNPHMSNPASGAFWDYSNFPTFHFSKEPYEQSLINLFKRIGGTFRYSTYHRKQLEKDNICGCFSCLEIFSQSEIKEWCFERESGNERVTAICPYCDVDAIIGESTGLPITLEFLKLLNKYCF